MSTNNMFYAEMQNLFFYYQQIPNLPVSKRFEPPHEKKKMTCAFKEDSDLPRLIRAFAICMKKPWVISYPLSAQQSL